MPELAEVDFFRRRWDAGLGAAITRVEAHPAARVFRGCDTALLRKKLRRVELTGSWAHGKQMLFGFSGGGWLGVHLGMTGELRVEPPRYRPAKHDHLVLRQRERALVFADARMFGRIRFELSPEGPPPWWCQLPPRVLSEAFTVARVRSLLERRTHSPLKAVLLDQACFPGIGNWMADEILWRLPLHPLTPAGSLNEPLLRLLRREVRSVARRALAIIGVDWREPPASWLYPHRWASGTRCPRCPDTILSREEAAGRTTCFCPSCQPPPSSTTPRRTIRTGHRRKRPVGELKQSLAPTNR